MNGKKAKAARQARPARSECEMNADKVFATTALVLATSISEFPTARTVQVPIGWMRAMMVQCRAIVVLSQAGQQGAVAPNRRSAVELLLRLQWLATMSAEARSSAIDAMIVEEKRLAETHKSHVIGMGLTKAPDFGDADSVVTQAIDDPALQQQAKSITDAAKASLGVGLYRAWRDETQMTHATIQLADALAPVNDGRFDLGVAPTHDAEHKLTLDMALFAVIYASRLLLDAGLGKHEAFVFFDAFFDGIRKVI